MKNGIKTLAMWLIIFIIFIVLISSIIDNSENKLAYSELLTKIEAGEVKEIEISADNSKANVKLKNQNVTKEVNIPSIENLIRSSFSIGEKTDILVGINDDFDKVIDKVENAYSKR